MAYRKASLLLVMLLVLTVGAAAEAADLQVPRGLAYKQADTTALVLEEYYGYGPGRDGLGSIDTGNATVNLRANSAEIYVVPGTSAHLPLPVSVYGDDFTIDIGLADWYTHNDPGVWSVYWTFHSAVGTNFQFFIKPEGIAGARGGEQNLSAPQNNVNVIRFTQQRSGDDPNRVFYANEVNAVSRPPAYYGSTENRWSIHTAPEPGTSVIHLAWVKIYKGVAAQEPPLAPMADYCGGFGVPYLAADITGPEGAADCYVDILDLAAMAADWLACTDPEYPELCE